MLCRRCSALLEAAGGPRPLPGAGPLGTSAAVVDRLCVGCGALLAPAGATARLLAKLAQLARFGLSGPATRLFKTTDPTAAGGKGS